MKVTVFLAMIRTDLAMEKSDAKFTLCRTRRCMGWQCQATRGERDACSSVGNVCAFLINLLVAAHPAGGCGVSDLQDRIHVAIVRSEIYDSDGAGAGFSAVTKGLSLPSVRP